MKFTIKTIVEQSFPEADKNFSEAFLIKLNPQFPPFRVLRFDGIKKSAEIHIELNFGLFKQSWEYAITDKKENDNEWSFVDEGTKTPFFLKYWHHNYQMLNAGETMIVSDTVTFKTPFFLLDYIMYPWLYIHFLYRKPIYKKRFKKIGH